MRLDCHIHSRVGQTHQPGETSSNALLEQMQQAGIDGGIIISPNPKFLTTEVRMQDTIAFCSHEWLFPFYWIDPLAEDASAQVEQAVKAGFDGFKMSCSKYYPGDQRALDVLEKIANADKPVLFHSGILWDGMESAKYNRPGNFEALIEIPKLRFCLAHMSWPWCDECFAVYGKFNNAYARRPDMSCEMFIDVTPGTPRPYREEALRHMIWTEYEYRYNVMFGTDCSANEYNVSWAKEWQERDDAIYEKIVEKDAEDFKEHVYCKNVLRFLGKSDEEPQKYIPMPGV